MSDFASHHRAAYATDGATRSTSAARSARASCSRDVAVRVPLATMNRHGLVAGATGTGKTKTLQVLAEQLSRAGVPVLVADVKGDVSGLARAGGAGRRRARSG